MGSSSSAPATPETSTNITAPSQPPPSCCPVQHNAPPAPQGPIKSLPSECPAHQDRVKLQASQCPISAGKGCDSATMDMGGAQLDPTNMMPPPNQQPSPDQPFLLPINRQISSIPRGGTGKDENWVYPSQQMFWNAMARKGWKWQEDQVKPNDMDNIIKIHNVNNERAWDEILKWEALHVDECATPKLLSFRGKAKEFSPRARIRSWMGYELPFDRHDWIIDRCGREVRYIIDYYDIGDEDGYKRGEFVALDVRPAMDSFRAVLDRARVAVLRWSLYFSSSKDE